MSDLSVNKALEIPALGRPFHLGMLYDCTEDKVLLGTRIWNQDILDRKFVENLGTTNFEIITSDSLKNKTCALNLSADLKLSFLGGLLDIKGSGKYLEDRVSSSHHERVTLKYKCTTKFEATMNQLKKDNMENPDILDHGTATHVVTGITYGGNAFFVFDREVTSESDRKEAHGRLRALVKKFPLLDVSGEGELDLSDDDKNEVEKIHCRFYGDFLLPKNPSTFKEAVRLYKMLPDLLGKNNERAVPVQVNLYPLALLDSKAFKLVRNISDDLVRDIEHIFEGLYKLELQCNDILETEIVQMFWRVQMEIKNFLSCLEDYRRKLRSDISSLLPKIRGGFKEEVALATIVSEDKKSPFRQSNLSSYIDGLIVNVGILSKYKSTLSMIPFARKGDLESLIITPGCSTVLCLSILIPSNRSILDEMEKYLGIKTCRTDSVGNDSETTAKKSPSKLSMMSKTTHYKEFFEANTNSDDRAFIVSHEHTDSREFGAEIKYFNDGKLIQCDFDIPTAPGKPVSDDANTTNSSIVVQWNPPSNGASNIVNYKVHYSKSREVNTAFELDAGLTNKYHIKDLESACDYKVWIQGVCEAGVTMCSDESDSIVTKPALQDGEFAKSKLCKISKVITRGKITIYKPTLEKIYEDNTKMLRKLQLGLPSPETEEKVIMLLGVTGSGKTTFINGLINYIVGVQWDDAFRFRLITEPLSSNQAKSQTTHICTYTIYHQQGFKIPYNLTIIDTPGFGDGTERDEQITKQISDFISTKESYGIDHLDAVCFVTSSSSTRLTHTQKYVFDQMLPIFGEDIAENIPVFLLFTFNDSKIPQALSSVEKANILYDEYFKFNNSALYSFKKSELDALFWKMGETSFQNFLERLKLT